MFKNYQNRYLIKLNTTISIIRPYLENIKLAYFCRLATRSTQKKCGIEIPDFRIFRLSKNTYNCAKKLASKTYSKLLHAVRYVRETAERSARNVLQHPHITHTHPPKQHIIKAKTRMTTSTGSANTKTLESIKIHRYRPFSLL